MNRYRLMQYALGRWHELLQSDSHRELSKIVPQNPILEGAWRIDVRMNGEWDTFDIAEELAQE